MASRWSRSTRRRRWLRRSAGCCSPPATGSAPAGLARLRHLLAVNDPTEEIGAAWGIKELLRQLLAAPTAQDARQPLFRFYHAVLNADMPEITTLAGTISTWWPAIEAFLRPHVTNARTEGTNGTIKQIKRVGYSYHNQANY